MVPEDLDILGMECGLSEVTEPQVNSLEQAKEGLDRVLDQLASLVSDFSNGLMDEWPFGSDSS